MFQGEFGFIKYELLTSNTPFAVHNKDNRTGALVVIDSDALDRETKPTFTLTVSSVHFLSEL